MRINGYLELPIKNLTLPFAPAISISYKTGIFPLSDDVVSDELNFIHPTRAYQFLASYDYPFLSYPGWLNLITLPSHGTVTAHAPCHVTYHRGTKMIHIFEVPDPNLPIHFVTFRALRRRLTHVIGEKWRFSHCEGHQSSLRMHSITWPVQNHAWQFFDPELSIHCTSFMGLRRRLRVFYIGASPC